MDSRIEALRKPFNRLKSRKKPKPPPAPKPGNVTAANSTEGAEDAAGAGEGSGDLEAEVGAQGKKEPFDESGLEDGEADSNEGNTYPSSPPPVK